MAGNHRSSEWLPQHRQAFDALRGWLKSTEGPRAPGWDLPFEAWADASQASSGGTSLRRDVSGAPRVPTPRRRRKQSTMPLGAASGDHDCKIHWVPGAEQGAADAFPRSTALVCTTASTFANSRRSDDLSLVCDDDACVVDRFATAQEAGSATLRRVRWQGHGPNDDALEPLEMPREQLSAKVLRRLRAVRETAADDEQLRLLVGSPPVDEPGVQTHTGTADGGRRTPCRGGSANGRTSRPPHRRRPRHPRRRVPHGAAASHTTPAQFERRDDCARQRRDPHLLDERAEAASGKSSRGTLPSGSSSETHAPTAGPRQGHDVTAVAVPESLVPSCLAAAHDLAGHRGLTSHVQS